MDANSQEWIVRQILASACDIPECFGQSLSGSGQRMFFLLPIYDLGTISSWNPLSSPSMPGEKAVYPFCGYASQVG